MSTGTLGIYVPGNTFMHRARPGAKIAALVAGGVAISFTRSLAILAIVFALQLLVMAAVRIAPSLIFRQLRSLAPLLIAILLAHAWLSGWRAGLVVDLRILSLVLAGTAVSATTRVSEMTDHLQRLAGPLRYAGVDPRRVALAISMAVRFVPLIAARAHEVRDAQRARGAERSSLALVVPLLIKTLQMADQTAEALQARGFD